jgi:hypothetical protein
MGRRDIRVVEQVGFCSKRMSLPTSVHRQVFGDDILPQPHNSGVTRLADQHAARCAVAPTQSESGGLE